MEAGPWISLGLKGANKMIDKHFDKVPHKYLFSDTYTPNVFKRRSRRKNSRDQDQKNSEEDEEEEEVDIYKPESGTERVLRDKNVTIGRDMDRPMPRDGSLPGGAYSQESPYINPPLYSHQPPHARPQYIPDPPPPPIGIAGGYYPPPPSETFAPSPYDRRSRNRRDSWDDDDDYYSDSYRQPRRPKPITRRSSSYHGPRRRDSRDLDDDSYGALIAGRGKIPSGSETVDRARHTAHRYGLKDEIENNFTKSKAGLAGGAVGAVVAGWAANKAQIGYSKGRKTEANPLVTLLGAAVGGLAVNAIVDKYEEAKDATAENQEKWEKKYGSDRDDSRSEGGRSQRNKRDDRSGYGSESGRSQRSKRNQRREDSAYGSDGYD
ncbi:hypothetical protein EG329_010403 [Mollisiaceae sp. DMI_Dod_QoI]|nr:hypothetical protein EG329_010403 [Helotiales sp. DMI_Dod_QoI]